MAVVAWQGVSYSSNESTTAAFVGIGGDGPGATFPIAVKDYPFTDPIFQNFQVQQYVTLGSAGAVTTYAVEAPDEEPHDVRLARLRAELHELTVKEKPTAKDKARREVVLAAIKKNGNKD